jgi:hypothetical protein
MENLSLKAEAVIKFLSNVDSAMEETVGAHFIAAVLCIHGKDSELKILFVPEEMINTDIAQGVKTLMEISYGEGKEKRHVRD